MRLIPRGKARLWWVSAGGALLLVASVSPPLRLPIDPSVFEDAACRLGTSVCLSVPPPAPPVPVVRKAPPPAWMTGAGLRILVSIPQQKAWVFDGQALLAISPVSTGKPGHE